MAETFDTAILNRATDIAEGLYPHQVEGVAFLMGRRTKNQVLDLPPKIRTWLDVDVSSRVAHRMSTAVLELLQKYSRRGVRETLEESPSSEERGRALCLQGISIQGKLSALTRIESCTCERRRFA